VLWSSSFFSFLQPAIISFLFCPDIPFSTVLKFPQSVFFL
jgi:hypothetical protein